MLNYKWCVFDLDGTLLNDDKNISINDLESIKLLKQNNVDIFIASGRTDMFSLPYLQLMDSKTPIISSNGALIRNKFNNEIIYSKYISEVCINKFIEYAKINKINYMAYTLDHVYYYITDERIIKALLLNNKSIIPSTIIYDHNILKYEKILKFLIIDEHENISIHKEELFKILNLQIVSSGYNLLDIMEYGVSKGYALEKLAQYYNMDQNKIIVFGDNYNDIEMFKFAGRSVAMGNAVDDIKAIADFVTTSNNENGIEYAIKNFILS